MRRIAIIGYGNIAKKHVEVFRHLGVEICASCNRSQAGCDLARDESGISNTYQDYHTMITREKPDGIIVSASFWLMFDILREVIPYGIPILAEKPSATSLEEHETLVELSNKHRTPVMVGLNRRHYSILESALQAIGDKNLINSVSLEWSENPAHLLHNRKLTDDQISKYIFGNSIHGIDLMCWLAGPFKNPRIDVIKRDAPYQWSMRISGKSDRGTLYSFFSDWTCPVPWRVSISAVGKMAILNPLEKCLFIDGEIKNQYELECTSEDKMFKAGFYGQAKRFLENNFADYQLDSVTQSMLNADLLTKEILGIKHEV